jgi:hypothetical protein
MKKLREHLSILLLCCVAVLDCDKFAQGQNQLEPESLLKKLVPEISGIKVVLMEDLEPNPEGQYRRHAFINGDFNRDGIEDIAISAVDAWEHVGISKSRNGYVLLASRNKNGTWGRVYFHKFPGLAHPFIIWEPNKRVLLIGANQTDSNPGEIVWDKSKKAYKLNK